MPNDSLFARLTRRLLDTEIRRQVRAALDAESDATFTLGARSLNASERDRLNYDRQEVIQQVLEAWRINPLARRIVGLTSQYVVGGGLSIACKHPAAAQFIDSFWNHRLNRMAVRCSEWCDELTRTGNLFVLLSTDVGGMSYVRAVPTAEIERIESRPNDVEQPLRFYPRLTLEEPAPQPWPVYEEAGDAPGEDGGFQPVMLHYAINRPVGAQWGESDLAPMLRWLARYANWLEDRARLNRFRTAFLYLVKGRYTSEAGRIARQQALNAQPPSPGSILVTDENETWEVIASNLQADDASADGLALKKMIAAGAGVPLHFWAEPESATRTTAEAAGGPTYRHYEQRQRFFIWLVGDVLRAVLNRRALVDRRIPRRVEAHIHGADISARDNLALAQAAADMMPALANLRDRGLIDDAEFLRLLYRFAGESVDVAEMLTRGRAAPPAGETSPGSPGESIH
jgi:hypothetical protein